VAVAAVASPLGETAAAEVVRWLVLLGAGALVAGVLRLGQTLFGTAIGALAAVIVFSRRPVWAYGELAYVDVPAAALVVWAAVLEARAPRRGVPVLVLLALAGLLRPEVWLLAAVYWLWLAPRTPLRRLAPLALLAAAGPLLWVAWDLVTAGGFLSSLHSQNAPAAPSSGGKGLHAMPSALVHDIGGFLRLPATLAGLAGALAGLAWLRTRSLLPAALGLLNGLGFAIVAAGGGPLEQRYLFPAAAMLALFAAVAVLGWRGLGDEPVERGRPGIGDPRVGRAWRVGGAVAAVALLAYAPVDIDRLHDLRAQVRAADRSDDELRDLLRGCRPKGRVHVPDVRLRPFVAYWADIPADRVGTEAGGTDIEPVDAVAQELISRSLPRTTNDNGRPPSWRIIGGCAR
jgi:hypothetical protein